MSDAHEAARAEPREPLVRVEGLSKAFFLPERRVDVLVNLSLEIHPGEMIALVGHSGVGKSTLLHILGTLEEPTSGRILFDGLEGEGDVLVRRVESLRDEYRNEVESHKAGLASLATAMGWSFASHRTDHPPETALMVLYRLLSEMVETKT